MSEENDPLVEAKKWLEQCRTTTDMAKKMQFPLVDHLNDEIDRLTKRVEKLEAAAKAEDDADIADAEAALTKGEFVPFEGPTVDLGSILEDRRDAQSCERGRGTIETIQVIIGGILAIPLAIVFAPFVLFPLAAWCVIRFAESVEPVVVRWFPGLKGRKGAGNTGKAKLNERQPGRS